MAFEIFGFKIERKSEERPNANVPAFALPENDDGSIMFAGGGAYGSYLNMEGEYKNEVELIIDSRLNELSPEQVKFIIKDIIHKHLGWLVVWGGVFGFLIGLILGFLGGLS